MHDVIFISIADPIVSVPLMVQHSAAGTSSEVNGAAHKYGQQPGGDTLTEFVTLVCQETNNSGLVSDRHVTVT